MVSVLLNPLTTQVQPGHITITGKGERDDVTFIDQYKKTNKRVSGTDLGETDTSRTLVRPVSVIHRNKTRTH